MTMLTPDEALYALLCKYLLKEADSNEQRWVNTWLQANAEHPVLLASLDKLLRTAPGEVVKGGMDTETAWRVLSERIELGERSGGEVSRGRGEVDPKGKSGMVDREGVGNEMEQQGMRAKGDLRGNSGMVDREGMGNEMEQQGMRARGDLRGNSDMVDREGMGNEMEQQGMRARGDLRGKNGMVDRERIGGAKPLSWWMAAAAAVFLLISVGGWYITHQNKRQINYDGAQLVKLEDGTSIQLDPAAQLQVLPGFGKRDRKVILKGKATFDVTTDASHPFIVDLGNQVITVLGTRFSVDNSNQLRVFIHSGKIKVTRRRDSVILTAGMLLEEDTSRQHYQVGAHITDAEARAVVFKDTPLREVLQTINVLYHVNVTADAALLELPVSGTYTGEPVKNVLDAIAYATNANVIINGADFELRPQD